jgi:hypothetical protein
VYRVLDASKECAGGQYGTAGARLAEFVSLPLEQILPAIAA